MIALEDWVTIKKLRAKNSAMSYREIARLVGVSPNTVISALARDEPPAYKRKSPPNPQLDPFREVIAGMANKQGLRGSRILAELRSKGYTGGKTALYALLSNLKGRSITTSGLKMSACGSYSESDSTNQSRSVGADVVPRVRVPIVELSPFLKSLSEPFPRSIPMSCPTKRASKTPAGGSGGSSASLSEPSRPSVAEEGQPKFEYRAVASVIS